MPPRDRRGVQYFAYPDWDDERLRALRPDGYYEAGADVRPSVWMNLRLEIAERGVVVFVDGQKVLAVECKADPVAGAIGLWVDIGTEAYFSTLKVTA